MIKPAIYSSFPIERFFKSIAYTDAMFWYRGDAEFNLPSWESNTNKFQYAVLNVAKDGEEHEYTNTITGEYTVGYFEYEVDFATKSVKNIKMLSFFKGNILFIKDVYNKIQELMIDFDRLEFSIVGGSPVERHLDLFVKEHRGQKHILHNCITDRHGKIYDKVIYEIITKQSTNTG